jgi:hypothetical protein
VVLWPESFRGGCSFGGNLRLLSPTSADVLKTNAQRTSHRLQNLFCNRSDKECIRHEIYFLSFLYRHRGGGHSLPPATPPDMRGRIRRFGWIELLPDTQPRKAKRVEVGDRIRDMQCLVFRDSPRTMRTPSGFCRQFKSHASLMQ